MSDIGVPFKIQRANDLLETIHELGQAIIRDEVRWAADLFGIQPSQWDVLTWSRVPDPHPEVGVLAGEFVHNLRSALDQLVYALAAERNGRPGRHTQFPIYPDEKGWKRGVLNRDESTCRSCGRTKGPSPLRGLSDAQIAFIGEHQPFMASDLHRHPLFQVAEISNLDKHRLLHVCAAQLHAPTDLRYEPAGVYEVGITKFSDEPRLVEVGAEFGRVQRITVGGTRLEQSMVRVRASGDAEIAFRREDESQPIASTADLWDMLTLVRDIAAALGPSSPDRSIGTL